jgi:outer membrane lipase/esterase
VAFGPAHFGPIVALDYARAKVDGYTESGDPLLTLNVGNQTAKSLRGQLGLEVRASLAGIRPYAEVAAEHEFSGDGHLIQFAQTDAPLIINHWAVSRDKDTYGRAAFGAAASVWGGASIDAAVTTTAGRHGGQETSVQVGLRASF